MDSKLVDTLIRRAGGMEDGEDIKAILGEEFAETDLGTELAEMFASEKKEAAKAAAAEIFSMVKAGQSLLDSYVKRLRETRRTEKTQMDAVKGLDRILQFGKETGNWLPLASELGRIPFSSIVGLKQSGKEDMLYVPKEWTPKSTSGTPAASGGNAAE